MTCWDRGDSLPLRRWTNGDASERTTGELYPDEPSLTFSERSRDLLTHSLSLRDADSVTLWIGTGLNEQLLLVWLRHLFLHLELDVSRLLVVQYSSDPARRFEVRGLGELNQDQLRAHPPAVELDEVALIELDAARSAVTAAEPSLLLEFLTEGTGGLPFLRRSLKNLLGRFPDFRTGVNRWELDLLRNTRERGPRVANVIGHTMAEDDDSLDLVGDGYLFARLRRLASPSLAQPLVKGNPTQMRGTEVRLTDAGQEVLAGNLYFLEMNGIDDWVGGIHLDSAAGDVWLHREGRIVLRS